MTQAAQASAVVGAVQEAATEVVPGIVGRRKTVPTASLKVAPERAGGRALKAKPAKAGADPGFIGVYSDAAGQANVVIGVDRFLRAQAAGLKSVQVYDFGAVQPGDARALALYAVLGRERSDAFSTARTLRDFVADLPEGTSSRDVANLFGTTHTTVLRYSKLWSLPDRYIEAGLQGRLKVSHAYRALTIPDEKERNEKLALLLGDTDQRRAAVREFKELARHERESKGYERFGKRLAGLEQIVKALTEEDRNKALQDLKAAVKRMARAATEPTETEVAHAV